MKESDWKIFRKTREIALQRLCQRILNQTIELAQQSERSAHERFLEVFKHVNTENEEIALCFDRLSRSTATHQLIAMHRRGLVTDEELQDFSQDTQDMIHNLDV